MTPGFADTPLWRPMVVGLGLLTMLMAGWRAVREYDLKLILAFGTVSQLGLITIMVGAGGPDMMLAGLAMLCAHAMFKAALFMVVGVIDHATGTRDIRKLAGLGAAAPSAAGHRRGRHREHGRAASVLRVRRQGGRSGDRAAQPDAGRRGPVRPRRHRDRLGLHHHLQPAIPVGRLFRQGSPPNPASGSQEMHRPPVTFLLPPAILAAAGLALGL